MNIKFLIHAGTATFLALVLGASQSATAQSRTEISATVSFGTWMSSPPLVPATLPPGTPPPIFPVDRFPDVSDTRFKNAHLMTPNVVKIKAGGSVNFIVSGLHNIIVYDNDTLPEDIDVTNLVNTTRIPVLPIINDPRNRIYRGLDPTLLAVDRVEAVRFDKPGTYLVICGLLPHFRGGMYGYVRVL